MPLRFSRHRHRPGRLVLVLLPLLCLLAGHLAAGVSVAVARTDAPGAHTAQADPDPTAPGPATPDPATPDPAAPEPALALPQRLQIPKLHIDAPVWQVGLDADGAMESPYSSTAVGWFSPGFVPGMAGNAVIAGHVDWVDHAAVFYFIKNLGPGDQLSVTLDDGSVLTFAVDGVEVYEDGETPLERVFGAADAPHLNLITCGGVFNQATHNYDHRTVVYTTLVTE